MPYLEGTTIHVTPPADDTEKKPRMLTDRQMLVLQSHVLDEVRGIEQDIEDNKGERKFSSRVGRSMLTAEIHTDEKRLDWYRRLFTDLGGTFCETCR